jgi:hypothetical protein
MTGILLCMDAVDCDEQMHESRVDALGSDSHVGEAL